MKNVRTVCVVVYIDSVNKFILVSIGTYTQVQILNWQNTNALSLQVNNHQSQSYMTPDTPHTRFT